MIRIAICDDEVKELNRTKEMLIRYSLSRPKYEIKTYSYVAPLELLSDISQQGGFDLILLDVYMTGILGTDAARELRKLGNDAEIIFLTTSKDHALDAFEVNATQYLVKPYKELELFAALDKVMQRIYVDRRGVITLKTAEGIARIAPQDVVFTETGRNNYQIIHIIQGTKLEVRMTAAQLFELLSQNKFFIRCGVSLSLNLKYIRQISKDVIVFDTGERLAYPYRVYQKLKDEFMLFQMNE